jgi:hypothetical protein
MSVRASRIVKLESITCPRRIGDFGPWAREEGLDAWERGRWAATQEEADAEVAEYMAANPRGGIGNVLWCYPGEQPRTCSFCGGIHPDDAVELLRAGWTVDCTGKSYKRYLEPPGHRAFLAECEARRQRWYDTIEASPDVRDVHSLREPDPTPRHPSPVPPVKLYTHHFTPAQIEAFNAALRPAA